MEQMAFTTFERQEISAARPIEAITEEILFYKQQAGAAILEIGRRLLEAKAVLPHGAWLPWLEEKVEFSEITAQRFMRLAREYRNPSPVTELGASKALVLLALPPEERDTFAAECHVVDGEMKSALEMTKRELEQAVKEKKEALEKLAAEQQITLDLQGEVKQAASTAEAALDEQARLRLELEEMKKRPTEVAVETVDASGEQLAEARANARREALAEAAEKIDHLEKQLEAAQAAKKPETAGDAGDIAAFKVLFDQAQDIINRMHGMIMKLDNKGDTEVSAKLRKALMALSEAVRKGAEG